MFLRCTMCQQSSYQHSESERKTEICFKVRSQEQPVSFFEVPMKLWTKTSNFPGDITGAVIKYGVVKVSECEKEDGKYKDSKAERRQEWWLVDGT
jgi:hypothetical protein